MRDILECENSSSTETDDEFSSVFFAAPCVTPVYAYGGQQEMPPELADGVSPARMTTDDMAAGLSTPVHSWISCTQQLMTFNREKRPQTAQEDDVQKSLLRFLFSPAEDSAGEGNASLSPLGRAVTPLSSAANGASSTLATPILVSARSGLTSPSVANSVESAVSPPCTAYRPIKVKSPSLGKLSPSEGQSTVYSILSRYLDECPPTPWKSQPDTAFVATGAFSSATLEADSPGLVLLKENPT
jgi:hypothetical protein